MHSGWSRRRGLHPRRPATDFQRSGSGCKGNAGKPQPTMSPHRRGHARIRGTTFEARPQELRRDFIAPIRRRRLRRRSHRALSTRAHRDRTGHAGPDRIAALGPSHGTGSPRVRRRTTRIQERTRGLTRGRLITVLFEGRATGAPQSIEWRADDLASGVYFVAVDAGGEVVTEKAIVVK